MADVSRKRQGRLRDGLRAVTIETTLIAVLTALLVVALFFQAESLLSRCLPWAPLIGKISYSVAGFSSCEADRALAWISYRLIETRFSALRERLDSHARSKNNDALHLVVASAPKIRSRAQ
jgi:peptidoglycan/LPS O-acetylase OafA/YrhL